MKKIRTVIVYCILSFLLFAGGVKINVSPADGADMAAGFRDDTGDPGNPDGEPGSSTDTDDTPGVTLDSGGGDEADADDTGSSDNTENSGPYYYSLLDDTQKAFYSQIEEAVAGGEESAVLEGISLEDMEKIFLCVQMDHPEYFWCEGSYSYRNNTDYIELIFNYNCTGSDREQRRAVVEKQTDEILAAMPKGDDYEKIKYVFETLIDRTDYDLAAPDNQNIYSVFGNWTSVCAGYAKSTKYLLDQAGIECIYVTGTANGESHAWNIVNCGGSYYNVDTTWGDPVYQEGHGVDISADSTAYEYLCCPDQMLSRTHTADASFPLPQCTDNSLEYYRLAGRYLDTFDQEAILSIMKADIDSGEEKTDIQFASPDIYNQATAQLDPILQEAMRYQQENTGGGDSVTYQRMDASCKITVYW